MSRGLGRTIRRAGRGLSGVSRAAKRIKDMMRRSRGDSAPNAAITKPNRNTASDMRRSAEQATSKSRY